MTEKVNGVARAAWSSKWAFIIAAAASAVGLGNMWRFPYLAAKYGGGTFLFTYLILVATVGISLLLLENAIGRKTGKSAISAFKKMCSKFKFVGYLTAAIPFLIVMYYCVIGGWVLKYLVSYITMDPTILADDGAFFTGFITGPTESYAFAAVFAALAFLGVATGLKGLEKINMFMMAGLIVLALGLAVYTAVQPGAIEGIAYYLTPDLSKFSVELLVAAMGQMFFSLSLAMAIMITYGSYYSKNEKLPSSAARVAGFDFGISVIAGFMIVPASFVAMGSGEAVASAAGPSLMFITMPGVFAGMGGAVPVVGFVFFLLVAFAALTSAISLTEAFLSIVKDETKWERNKCCIVIFIILFAGVMIVNAGYNVLSFVQPLGEGTSILDFLDFISNTIMMPLAALLTCIVVGWVVGPKYLIEEIELTGPFKMKSAWSFIIKFVAPVVIVIVMIGYTLSTFGMFSM